MYKLYFAVVYTQPVGRMALFSTLCCHASLGSIFHKIRTLKRHSLPSQNTLSQNRDF